MAKRTRTFKRVRVRAKKRRLRREVMESIIYFGSRNQKTFPAEEKYILSAIFSATAEYLRGRNSFFIHYGVDDNWEKNIHEELKALMKKEAQKLDPQIKKTLIHFSDYEKQCDEFVGGYETCFHHLFKPFLYSCNRPSLFIVSENFGIRVEKKVLPFLTKKIRLQCEEIGRKMENYIKKDVILIKNNGISSGPE